MTNKIITLLTDFGEEDWFVGSMKGVIASICPAARTVDITHLIPHGDIRRGAFALRCSYSYFPRGTVHMAVVDPGVGSTRDILVVRGGGYIFIAPDNGLLSYILADLEDKTIHHATRKEFFLDKMSNTFHGRDIFAPLAAHLAGGLSSEQVGPVCGDPVILPQPICRPDGNNRWEVEIITTDRFGNCITSLPLEKMGDHLSETRPTRIGIIVGKEHISLPLVKSYNAVEEWSPLAIRGSCDYLELAVNGGDAARQLSLQTGDKIKLKIEYKLN